MGHGVLLCILTTAWDATDIFSNRLFHVTLLYFLLKTLELNWRFINMLNSIGIGIVGFNVPIDTL